MNARRNFLLAVAALFVLLAVAVVSGLLAVVHAAVAMPLGVMALGVMFGGRPGGSYDDGRGNVCQSINPATGLPLIAGGHIDIGGNPFGAKNHH